MSREQFDELFSTLQQMETDIVSELGKVRADTGATIRDKHASGVDDDGAHELKSALLQGCRHRFGQRRFRGRDYRSCSRSACLPPSSRRRSKNLRPPFASPGRCGRREWLLQFWRASARCRRSSEAASLLPRRTARRLPGRTLERLAKNLSLSQDGQPRQDGLKAVEHELFPEGTAVMLRHAPLFIVVRAEQGVCLGPSAAVAASIAALSIFFVRIIASNALATAGCTIGDRCRQRDRRNRQDDHGCQLRDGPGYRQAFRPGGRISSSSRAAVRSSLTRR